LNLTKLEFLYCNVNLENFSNFLTTTTIQLDTLKFYEKKFTKDLFQSIGKYAKRTQNFATLYLGSPDDDSDSKSDFGSMFQDLSDSNLKKLLLQEFEIKNQYVKDFRKFIKRSKITHLCLDMIGFSQSSLAHLRKMFKGSRLEKLEIKGYYLTDELCTSIKNIPFLIVSPSMPIIFNLLDGYNNLYTLDIGDRYVATPEILKTLKNNKTLKRCFFTIDNSCLPELCVFIKNCALLELKIRGNSTEIDLTQALSINKTLKSIVLFDFNQIGDLSTILWNNGQLINLYSDSTYFENMNSLIQGLQNNTTLCYLKLVNLNEDYIQLLDRNRRIRSFPQEKLWRLCYKAISNEHLIPQTIQDQWNENHPDRVDSIVIVEEEDYFWYHEFNNRRLFIDKADWLNSNEHQ
jgi:hypothetical protein